jgi:Iodothyronine deiodinase
LGELSRLYRAYRERVAFFIVYIREAHPEDGWVLTDNRDAGVRVSDPQSQSERQGVAETCATLFSLEIPVLVDGVGDEVARLYGGWPERLYLIGADGTIAYQGEEGPFGFHPEELEAAIERELSRDQPGEATATI